MSWHCNTRSYCSTLNPPVVYGGAFRLRLGNSASLTHPLSYVRVLQQRTFAYSPKCLRPPFPLCEQVKSRVMGDASGQYKGTIDCFVKTFKNEVRLGCFSSFYRCILRSMLETHTVCFFSHTATHCCMADSFGLCSFSPCIRSYGLVIPSGSQHSECAWPLVARRFQTIAADRNTQLGAIGEKEDTHKVVPLMFAGDWRVLQGLHSEFRTARIVERHHVFDTRTGTLSL
jgi:hypothetical protein